MFIRKLSVMMLAVLTAQVLGFFASMILAKLLTPTEFGIYGLIQSVSMVLVPLLLLSSSHSILVIKKEANIHWVTSIVSSSSFVAILILIAFLLFLQHSNRDLNNIIIIILAISMSYYQLLYSVFVRYSSHVDLAKLTLFASVVLFALKISAGYLFSNGVSVAIAHFIAVTVAAVFALMLKGNAIALFKTFNLIDLKRRFKLLSPIIFYKTPTDLLSVFAQAVPIFSLGYFFGMPIAGYYVLAKSLVLAPSKLIAKSITDISIGPIIQAIGHHQDRAYKQYVKLTGLFFILSIVIFGFIFFVSPSLVNFFYGKEWSSTSDIIRLLTFWLAVSFVSKPATLLVSKLKLNQIDFYLEVTFSILKISAITLVSYFYENYLIGIALYSFISGLKYAFVFFLVSKKMTSKVK